MSDVEMETKPVHIEEEDRLKIQGDLQNATFSFYDEDHTLGNLLRNQKQIKTTKRGCNTKWFIWHRRGRQ